MTNENPTLPQGQEPFIPPSLMLMLALGGLMVAFIVGATQPTFTVVGWGALGIAILSLVAWAFMAPQQARAVLTGRTARFGGTSLLVTAIFLGALVAVYVLVRNQNWRADLTERDTFSLTPESRQAITGIGVDPNLPKVRLRAFYTTNQAETRDQDSLLFEDYAEASQGKISYEFVDPDRNPAQVELYNTTLDTQITGGQIVVEALDAAGEPDIENAEVVSFFNQDDLTNAILRVAASGDFRAYFLNVDDGLSLSDMSVMQEDMTDLFDWTLEEVSLFELMGENSEITLNDPAADGEVLVIPGGSTPLTDDELAFITAYVDQGGDLVILAAPSINEENTALATGENLSTYLYENFGLRFRNDVVIDPSLSWQGSPLLPIADQFDPNSFITTSFPSGQYAVLFQLPHSIEIAPTLPANVVVSELISTGDTSYAKTDMNAILNNDVTQAETDPRGPFVLGASAENSQTGARVVLYGNTAIFENSPGQVIVNRLIARTSLAWATNFNDFFNQITVQSAVRPQDAPVFATDQVIRNITLLTVFVIPFGVLAIGLLVWWNNRERGNRLNTTGREG